METITWNNYRIGRIHESDYGHLATIYKNVYKKNFTTAYFAKKYATGYLGVKDIGCIAFAGEMPVANFLAIPWPLEYKGREYLSTQSCDSATDPRHRGRGLSTMLGKCTYELARENGIFSTFGCPNQNSFHVLTRKLGWKLNSPLIRYEIPVHRMPLPGMAAKLGLQEKHIHYARNVFRRYQVAPTSFHSLQTGDSVTVSRNADYLDYKSSLGNFFIVLRNTVFWIKITGGSLVIGDLLATNETYWREAIKQLVSLTARAGLRNIIFQTQAGSKEAAYFSAYYPEAVSLQAGYQDYGCGLPLDSLKLTFADLDTF